MQIISPSIGLLSKLATIAQIVDGASTVETIDMDAARALLADREVTAWLDGMHKQGLIHDHRRDERMGIAS